MLARESISAADTPSASAANQPAERLQELLRRYDQTMRAAAAVPWFVRVPAGQRWSRRFRLWRPTFLLQFFVVRHVAKQTSELERAYWRQAGITGDRDLVRVEQQLLEDFRKSLPPTPSPRLLLILALIGILALTRLFGLWLANPASRFDTTETKLLQNLEDSFFSLNVHSNGFEAIASTPWRITGALLSVVLFSAYLIFRPFWSPFRLKRLLFNLVTDDRVRLGSAAMSDAARTSDGLYKLEASALAAAGARRKQEFPFDLVVSALIPVLLIGDAFVEPASYAAVEVALGLPRLGWLVWAGIARRRGVHRTGRRWEDCADLSPSRTRRR